MVSPDYFLLRTPVGTITHEQVSVRSLRAVTLLFSVYRDIIQHPGCPVRDAFSANRTPLKPELFRHKFSPRMRLGLVMRKVCFINSRLQNKRLSPFLGVRNLVTVSLYLSIKYFREWCHVSRSDPEETILYVVVPFGSVN